MHRLAIAVLLAGCRLHFDDRPTDAAADAPPHQLACNTPVKLFDTPIGTSLSAVSTSTSILAAWIEPDGHLGVGRARLVAADQVIATDLSVPGDTGYTAIANAAANDVIVGAYTENGTSYVEVLDANLVTIGTRQSTSVAVTSPLAVAMTGSTTGVIAAVTGNDLITNRAAILPVNADGTLGTEVDSGNVNNRSMIVNAGTRFTIVDNPPVNTCEIKTADLAVTSRTTTVAWGTTGQCTQPVIAYSPGRADALLVRHDLTDNDLNHTIATRSGQNYATAPENRLRNPGSEARPVGVADGYISSYETGGTLEAAHVDFAAVVGTPIPLGPLSEPTAHATVIHGTDVYVIWLQDGLELARLCP